MKYGYIFHGYTSTFTINLSQPAYWWLRSPRTVSDSITWLVGLSGDVGYGGGSDRVWDSYGNYRYNLSFRNTYSSNPSKSINGQADYWWLRSPYPDTPNDAYLVDLYGDVDYGGYTYVGGSYGRVYFSFIYNLKSFLS